MSPALLERSLEAVAYRHTDWQAIAEHYAEACRHAEAERDGYCMRLDGAIRDLHAYQIPEPGFRRVLLSIDQDDILRFALRELIMFERSRIQSDHVDGEPDDVTFIRQYGMLFNALFPRPGRRS